MNNFTGIYTQDQALDAVQKWAQKMILIRETSAIFNDAAYKQGGRIDGLLIPGSWTAPSYKALGFKQGIVGVEIKLRRADFLRGLAEGQFEKYAERLCALYICTRRRACKTSEIPEEYGHLVVAQRPGYGLVCVCRRAPRWKQCDLTQTTMYKILWAVFNETDRIRKEHLEEAEALHERIKKTGAAIIGRLMRKELKEIKNG